MTFGSSHFWRIDVKKSFMVLAVISASGGAAAQSSVSIYGTIDAGAGYIKSTGAGHMAGLVTGGNTTSRLGFRGTEDLGGGWAASFRLEGAVQNDTGGGATAATGFDFQRRSTVSLSSRFGELRMGRDFAAHFVNQYTFDVTGSRGVGQMETPGVSTAGANQNAFRVNNAVAYFLPGNLGGFYGHVQYAFGERPSSTAPTANASGISNSAANAATSKSGNYLGLRGGYAGGPLNVSVSYGQQMDAIRTVGTSFYAANYRTANIGAAYDLGFIRPLAFFQREQMAGRGAIPDFRFDTFNIGATAPFGPHTVRVQASYYEVKNTSREASKISAGYMYNLSKRTFLYGEVGRIDNKGGNTMTFAGIGGLSSPVPTPGGHSTAFTVGLTHSF